MYLGLDLDIILKIVNILLLLPFGLGAKWLKDWRDENKKRDKEKKVIAYAHNLAIMSLLRDRILQSGQFFVDLGAIPSHIKASLLKMGEAYELMGGNGDGHEMIEQIKLLLVDDSILEKTRHKEEVSVE